MKAEAIPFPCIHCYAKPTPFVMRNNFLTVSYKSDELKIKKTGEKSHDKIASYLTTLTPGFLHLPPWMGRRPMWEQHRRLCQPCLPEWWHLQVKQQNYTKKRLFSTSHINPKSVSGTERQATVVRVYQDGEASTARNPLCHYHPHEHPLKTTVHYAKYVSPYLPNSHLRFDY